jgi:hypothetical protein
MQRFIITFMRSVTEEFSASTWRSMGPDVAGIDGHHCRLFMFQFDFESFDELADSAPFRFGNLFSTLDSQIVKLFPGSFLTLL